MKKKDRIWICPLLVMGFILILNGSCKKDDDHYNPEQVPVLTTFAISDITQTTASSGGNITSDKGLTVTVRGVCWSTETTPYNTDSKTTDGTGTGSFTSAITGLSPNTTYYMRAYATNSAGTGYGSVISFTTKQGMIDVDGNIYQIVTIGTQTWMAENLKVTHYCNGDPIPNISDGTKWDNLTTGAYCNYNNNANYSTTYGRLYNGYAVNDSRNIAPTGWHIPSDAEWTTLTDYLGGENVAGGKLKETGTTHWRSPNTGATNESGFTALPGGHRVFFGTFEIVGMYGEWWSSTESYSTEYQSPSTWGRSLDYWDSEVTIFIGDNNFGFSVRCLRD